jgi:tetratricopeptide (TPR) repeat protein
MRAAVTQARGPLAYVALRQVWAEWEAGDPVAVEEALHEVATDGAEPAAVRSYAGLLEAYARRRRGDLDGARARIASLGYVDRWMIAGPFDNDGKAGFSPRFDPENEQGEPLNLTRDYGGKDRRPVRWRLAPAVSPYGWVDVGAMVRPADHACVLAVTFVRDARVRGDSSRAISIWAGAAGAMRVDWNGVRAIEDEKYRDLDSDRIAATVTLRAGWNRLFAKVCGDERSPMLALRLAGPDGAPDKSLEIDPSPVHSTREGDAVQVSTPSGPARPPIETGPVPAFELGIRSGDPAMLEGYARYLHMTGADDPTENRARELARQAAEKAPTVRRLLLAGEVAESRNQRAAWIEQAAALALARHVSEAETMDVLLARAEAARAGVNPRDAMPIDDQALALDPDNVPATLAKIDLYEDAGLRDTALAELARALARRPRSVALLRAAVAALRDQGRETEADEMAERYAALRFDDPTFIRAHVELAIARRDRAAAARWLDRLVAMSPDSVTAYQAAATAWARLGERARAVAAYRMALEIAPEDTDVMRQLASLHGLIGDRDEQVRLLKRVVELRPQAKDARDELAHVGPPTPRPDEQYARPASEFLAGRGAAAAGQARRSLVDLQVTTVFANGLASRFRQVVYQPLTEAAAAQAREFEFSFETDSEIVQLRAARVYRADGRIDEAVESGAGSLAEDPSLAIYTTSRSYYVRFPRLEPGDVVELQYRVEDVAERNAFADYFGEVVYLESTEPVARSEYVLITPKWRKFYFNEPNVPGLTRTTEERGDQRIVHFLARNLGAAQQEPLQPPWAEVLGHVNVSTYESWDEMGRWYWGLIKDQLVPDDEVRRLAFSLAAGAKDDAAKARAIYDYVVQKTRYVALEFGIHGYKPYRCAQILARGFGDCKDKATLIVTMLGALGIKATPVVVRTGNKGDIETAPASLAPFDHMVAYVPSLGLYLDGTAEYTGSLELPAMDRGALALQVNEGAPKLVHLPDPPADQSVSSARIEAALSADGSAQLDWRSEVSGVTASEWRVRFHADATRRQRAQQWLAAILPGSQLVSLETGDFEDIEQPVTMRVRGRVPQFARPAADGVTVPLGRKEHMIRDFAPLPSRTRDVRLAAQFRDRDDWTIRLPAGAQIKSLPASAHGASPFGDYAFDVESTPGSIRATTTVSVRKTRVSAQEYPAFRAWCEEVDRALGQQATVEFKGSVSSGAVEPRP